MKHIGKIFLSLFFIVFSQSTYAGIVIAACDSKGSAQVVYSLAKGKWAGFSGKTKSGEIIDHAAIKLKIVGVVGSGSYRFVLKTRDKIVAVRASTWDGKDGRLMSGRRDDTGWVSCK